MKFFELVNLIEECAGKARVEAVVEQEICEDAAYLAKCAADPMFSDAALGRAVRNALEMSLHEEADYQQDLHAKNLAAEMKAGI